MKQTAVEWLEDSIDREMPYREIIMLIKQAKEIEKQHIIDAYNSGQQIPPFEFAEQHYNETFKN